MNLEEYSRQDAFGLADLARRREVTPRELAELARKATAKVNPAINAVVELFDDAIADPVGNGANPDGPFFGVPIILKDLASRIRGRVQSGGMEAWADAVAAEDDPLVSNFRAAGYNIVGRATCSEQGITFMTWTRRFGLTRNPFDLDHTSGGSSGGSGALVAAGIAPVAGANDGGGSTRCPAAWNGLVGLKPSRGLLPMPPGLSEAIMANGVEGMLSRSVRDHALSYDFLARRPLGSSFIRAGAPACSYLDAVFRVPRPRHRIAVSTGPWAGVTPDPEVLERTLATASLLRDLGHQVEEVADEEICDFETLLQSFVTWNWVPRRSIGVRAAARDKGVALNEETLSPIGLRHVEAADRITYDDILKAQLQNEVATRQFGRFFERFDLLLTPATSIRCPKAEVEPYSSFSSLSLDDWIWTLLRSVPYTVAGNATGLPAIVLPAGLDSGGLPVGVQIYAPWMEEMRLFAIAAEIERATPENFHRRPPIHAASALPVPPAGARANAVPA